MDNTLVYERMENDMSAPVDPEALACIQEPYKFRVILDFTSDEQGKRVSMELKPIEPAYSTKININITDVAILMDSIRHYITEMIKGEANQKFFRAQLDDYLKKHLFAENLAKKKNKHEI